MYVVEAVGDQRRRTRKATEDKEAMDVAGET